MKNKAFDCVEMMHKGQEDLMRRMAGMSTGEKQEYWHKKTLELRALQQQIRQQASVSSNATESRP